MQYFIPSDTAPRLGLLANAFPVLPPAVARASIELCSQPGDLILDPFCIGTSVIEAALDLGRKVVATSFNPINLLAIEHTLWPIDARAALTHLADAPKGSRRLRDHVIDLYTTRCPTCGKPSTAMRFVWDREQNIPLEKHVYCESCGENEGPTDETDVANAQRSKPRGLPFWYLHGRVIDRQHDEAERVSEVLDAYTPRAQSALNDILLKYDTLSDADQAALRPALLAMFDASTSLHTPDEARYPSGLKPPPRFVERNVWLELEKKGAFQQAGSLPFQRVSTIDELRAMSSPAVCLIAAPARELVKQLPGKMVPLIVTHPLLPKPGFWSLNAVWAAWLWGRRAMEPLQSLLSRRRTNWDWQWRAIGAALHTLKPALCDDAHCVMAFANDESVLESVTLAAASAHYVIDHLVCDPQDGVRVTWHVAAIPGRDTVGDLGQAANDLREITRRTAVGILRDRAEPASWPVLQAGILTALGQRDTLNTIAQMPEGDQLPLAYLRNSIHAALDGSAAFEIEPQVWWLRDGSVEESPLSDRVERAVADRLRSRAEWQTPDLLHEIYRHFPDHLTPDRALIATTIGSYAVDAGPDRLRLRDEDQTPAREAEVNEVMQTLTAVGKRLGFEARHAGQAAVDQARHVVWLRHDRVAHEFVISADAAVETMLRGNADVLVIPGGRATLLQHKLARDARLRETRQQVLKFSSLRRIAQQADLSLATFHLAFGLEPPIEQPGTQIQLW